MIHNSIDNYIDLNTTGRKKVGLLKIGREF